MCILGHGSVNKPVEHLSTQVTSILRTHAENEASPECFQQLSLILPRTQLARVLAVQEMFRRWTQHHHRVFRSPRDALLLLPELARAAQEHVVVLYLAANQEILRQEVLAVGSWNAAWLTPKEVFYPIRWAPVESIIVCHNHPSGSLLPSEQDKQFTGRLQQAAELLGVQLQDHLILSREGYFSFREAGLLSRL